MSENTKEFISQYKTKRKEWFEHQIAMLTKECTNGLISFLEEDILIDIFWIKKERNGKCTLIFVPFDFNNNIDEIKSRFLKKTNIVYNGYVIERFFKKLSTEQFCEDAIYEGNIDEGLVGFSLIID